MLLKSFINTLIVFVFSSFFFSLGCTKPVPEESESTTDCRMQSASCADGFSCVIQANGSFACMSDGYLLGGGSAGGDSGGSEMMNPMAGMEVSGGSSGGIETPSNSDCRTTGCASDQQCLDVGFDQFVCQARNSCNTSNGGCGDPSYVNCVPSGSDVICEDIRECDYNNGNCGPASQFSCFENYASPPSCQQIEMTSAPTMAGSLTFTTLFNYQGSMKTCHALYLATNHGLADNRGGCEECTYAWNLRFELVQDSCPFESPGQSLDIPFGVNLVTEDIMFKYEGQWNTFGGEGTRTAVSNNTLVAVGYERPSPMPMDLFDVRASTQTYALTWGLGGQSCGDLLCSFDEYGCSEDCLNNQTPATGFRMVSYGFKPEDSSYSHCVEVNGIYPEKRTPPAGCSRCTEKWATQVRKLISTCGSWSSPVGTTRTYSYGAENQSNLVIYSDNEWKRITQQYNDYYAQYRSLVAASNIVTYSDANNNGRRDSDERRRYRSQAMIFHY